MSKKVIMIFVFISSFLFFKPMDAYAFSYDGLKYISPNIYLLDDEEFEGISNIDEAGIDVDKYNQDQNCEGLLGDKNNPDTVAWLLQEILDILKVVGPLLVVVLSSFDFAKVIISGDNEAMNKAGKKLGIRLALAVALFLIPTLVTVLLDVFGITGDPTCGIG